jgi:hypothetical protein
MEHGPLVAFGRLGGSARPRHDVDILLIEHSGEQRALGLSPGFVVCIEKPADQQIRFEGAAMVRSPMEALQLSVGVHRRDVGI